MASYPWSLGSANHGSTSACSSPCRRRLGVNTYPTAINRWIAKGELEAFRVEGKVFRFVDAEQVRGLGLTLDGYREADMPTSRSRSS